MKILILDHHFRSDIDALVNAVKPSDVVRVVPAELFASRARRIFPDRVFGADLAVYGAADLEGERIAYQTEAREVIFALYKSFPFDVFVVPNDTYFYIRDVIDALHELDIPTVAVQKESGVSATAIASHAAEIKRSFPVTVDLMTVCSELSKTFWIGAGAKPADVLVLGQPRFDIYANTSTSTAPAPLRGFGPTREKPVILFLSYDLDAYDEDRSDQTRHPWKRLHRDTEQVLVEVAKEGLYSVYVKPHPQQRAGELNAMRRRLRRVPGLNVLRTDLDSRQLIFDSDLVIGFQTTAIAEAMVAGKRTIYTFWTDEVKNVKDGLLPFHTMGDALEVAVSPGDLRARLSELGPALTDAVMLNRQRYCEPYLGIVDGNASKRVMVAMNNMVMGREFDVTPTRAGLNAEAKGYCSSELRIAKMRAIFWAGAAAISSPFWWTRTAKRCRGRLASEAARVRECKEGLMRQYRHVAVLRGPRRSSALPWTQVRP